MDRGQLRVARDRYWSPRDAASLRTRIITRDEGEEEEIASLDPHLATRRSISLLPAHRPARARRTKTDDNAIDAWRCSSEPRERKDAPAIGG